jgi:hypothetical protein
MHGHLITKSSRGLATVMFAQFLRVMFNCVVNYEEYLASVIGAWGSVVVKALRY